MTRPAPYEDRHTCGDCALLQTCKGDVGPSCTSTENEEHGHLLSRRHQACAFLELKVKKKPN